MPDLELKIEQLTAAARREALPTFDGKTATTVLVDTTGSFTILWRAHEQTASASKVNGIMVAAFFTTVAVLLTCRAPLPVRYSLHCNEPI